MGGAQFSSCSLAWGQTVVGIMAVMVTSFKRMYAPRTVVFSVPDCWSMPPPDTPGHSRANLAQSPVGSLLLSPGSWCTQDFVCAHQESISPVLWKFYNQIPLAFKVKFPEDSQSLCQILRLGNLLWAIELLQQGRNSFGVIFLVCGLSAWWLYGGANGNLFQEDLCHRPHLLGLLKPEPLFPQEDTADLCLYRRH